MMWSMYAFIAFVLFCGAMYWLWLESNRKSWYTPMAVGFLIGLCICWGVVCLVVGFVRGMQALWVLVKGTYLTCLYFMDKEER